MNRAFPFSLAAVAAIAGGCAAQDSEPSPLGETASALGIGVVPVPGGASLVLSQPTQYIGYGLHYPEGLDAVQYLYGPEGTFKEYSVLQDIYGYYSGWSGGPYGNQQPTGTNSTEVAELVAYADGANATTTPDANDHALDQLASGGEATFGSPYVASFHEHNGRGAGGATKGNPFTQFWFDDNWLARDMSEAYGAPQPFGLWATSDFNRWQILALDTTHWTPYASPAGYPDLLVLNGLYDLATGDTTSAVSVWNQILAIAGTTYDSANQRYSYPGLLSEYYLGLFKILTDKLILSGLDAGTTSTLVQHAISLRSDMISDQQQESGVPIGWLTGGSAGRTDPSTLINTETTAVDVLGLGAGARYSFEVGRSPLSTPAPSGAGQFYLRPHNVLSAVVGLSPTGFMSYGPYMSFPAGAYTVDYYLRAPSPTGDVAYVDVNDYTINTILASQEVMGSQMVTGNQWTRVSLPVTIPTATDQIEVRVVWRGTTNLDVSTIRIR
jgi:hypothetical protein